METATAMLDNATDVIGNAFELTGAQRKLVRVGLIGGVVYLGWRILRNLATR